MSSETEPSNPNLSERERFSQLTDVSMRLELLQERKAHQAALLARPPEAFFDEEDRLHALSYVELDIHGAARNFAESVSLANLGGALGYGEAADLLRANDINVEAEPAEAYQDLLESLTPGAVINFYPFYANRRETATIIDASTLYLHADTASRDAVARAAIMIPIRYNDEIVDHEIFYPRRSRRSRPGEMIVPGLELA